MVVARRLDVLARQLTATAAPVVETLQIPAHKCAIIVGGAVLDAQVRTGGCLILMSYPPHACIPSPWLAKHGWWWALEPVSFAGLKSDPGQSRCGYPGRQLRAWKGVHVVVQAGSTVLVQDRCACPVLQRMASSHSV
eukprot:122083-Pelagomonas_calceolata.AAC.1